MSLFLKIKHSIISTHEFSTFQKQLNPEECISIWIGPEIAAINAAHTHTFVAYRTYLSKFLKTSPLNSHFTLSVKRDWIGFIFTERSFASTIYTGRLNSCKLSNSLLPLVYMKSAVHCMLPYHGTSIISIGIVAIYRCLIFQHFRKILSVCACAVCSNMLNGKFIQINFHRRVKLMCIVHLAH